MTYSVLLCRAMPAGVLRFSWAMRRTTCESARPWACRRTGSTFTMIARSCPPVTVAEATPSADSTRGTTWLSMSVRSFTGFFSPVTPKMRMGNWLGSNLRMMGVDRVGSVGKDCLARSTSCSTSTAAWPMSVPHWNCTRTIELPSWVLELTR